MIRLIFLPNFLQTLSKYVDLVPVPGFSLNFDFLGSYDIFFDKNKNFGPKNEIRVQKNGHKIKIWCRAN